VPLDLCTQIGIYPDTILPGDIVPCGINILRGDIVRYEQEEYRLVLERVDAAINVNRPEDIKIAERLCRRQNNV